jgi:ABC-type antimicrobial peptide transport system permease subunit
MVKLNKQINHTIRLVSIFFEAKTALLENRTRTALSLLGITIGIASVSIVFSVNDSGRTLIFNELETFGLRSIWVSRNISQVSTDRPIYPGTGISTADYLYLKDRCCKSLKAISPIVIPRAVNSVIYQGKRLNISIVGVDSSFFAINNERLLKGRFFLEDEVQKRDCSVVLSEKAADLLHIDISNSSHRDGYILMGDKFCSLVGIVSKKNRDFLSSINAVENEPDLRLIAPYTVTQELNGDSSAIGYIQGEAASIELSTDALDRITDYLTAKYEGKYAYRGESLKSYIDTANNILKGVSLMGVTAAVISLLVGGLAIMNIMLISVVERTKEIGIRMAVGARKTDILLQFIFEAILISLLSGIFGELLGIGLIKLIPYIFAIQIEVSVAGLVIALLCSILIGLVSGLYPAMRASNLTPIEALRYE